MRKAIKVGLGVSLIFKRSDDIGGIILTKILGMRHQDFLGGGMGPSLEAGYATLD
jgi:hypothetical protein